MANLNVKVGVESQQLTNLSKMLTDVLTLANNVGAKGSAAFQSFLAPLTAIQAPSNQFLGILKNFGTALVQLNEQMASYRGFKMEDPFDPRAAVIVQNLVVATQKLNKAFSDVQANLKSLQTASVSELNALEKVIGSQQKLLGELDNTLVKTTQNVRSAVGSLTGIGGVTAKEQQQVRAEIKATETKLKELKELRDAVFGKGVTIATPELKELRAEISATDKQLKELRAQARGIVISGGTQASSDLEKMQGAAAQARKELSELQAQSGKIINVGGIAKQLEAELSSAWRGLATAIQGFMGPVQNSIEASIMKFSRSPEALRGLGKQMLGAMPWIQSLLEVEDQIAPVMTRVRQKLKLEPDFSLEKLGRGFVEAEKKLTKITHLFEDLIKLQAKMPEHEFAVDPTALSTLTQIKTLYSDLVRSGSEMATAGRSFATLQTVLEKGFGLKKVESEIKGYSQAIQNLKKEIKSLQSVYDATGSEPIGEKIGVLRAELVEKKQAKQTATYRKEDILSEIHATRQAGQELANTGQILQGALQVFREYFGGGALREVLQLAGKSLTVPIKPEIRGLEIHYDTVQESIEKFQEYFAMHLTQREGIVGKMQGALQRIGQEVYHTFGGEPTPQDLEHPLVQAMTRLEPIVQRVEHLATGPDAISLAKRLIAQDPRAIDELNALSKKVAAAYREAEKVIEETGVRRIGMHQALVRKETFKTPEEMVGYVTELNDRMAESRSILHSFAQGIVRATPESILPTNLEEIPGVGPVLAKRIRQFEETRGPIRKPEELLPVKGMGESTYAQVRAYLEHLPQVVPPELSTGEREQIFHVVDSLKQLREERSRAQQALFRMREGEEFTYVPGTQLVGMPMMPYGRERAPHYAEQYEKERRSLGAISPEMYKTEIEILQKLTEEQAKLEGRTEEEIEALGKELNETYLALGKAPQVKHGRRRASEIAQSFENILGLIGGLHQNLVGSVEDVESGLVPLRQFMVQLEQSRGRKLTEAEVNRVTGPGGLAELGVGKISGYALKTMPESGSGIVAAVEPLRQFLAELPHETAAPLAKTVQGFENLRQELYNGIQVYTQFKKRFEDVQKAIELAGQDPEKGLPLVRDQILGMQTALEGTTSSFRKFSQGAESFSSFNADVLSKRLVQFEKFGATAELGERNRQAKEIANTFQAMAYASAPSGKLYESPLYRLYTTAKELAPPPEFVGPPRPPEQVLESIRNQMADNRPMLRALHAISEVSGKLKWLARDFSDVGIVGKGVFEDLQKVFEFTKYGAEKGLPETALTEFISLLKEFNAVTAVVGQESVPMIERFIKVSQNAIAYGAKTIGRSLLQPPPGAQASVLSRYGGIREGGEPYVPGTPFEYALSGEVDPEHLVRHVQMRGQGIEKIFQEMDLVISQSLKPTAGEAIHHGSLDSVRQAIKLAELMAYESFPYYLEQLHKFSQKPGEEWKQNLQPVYEPSLQTFENLAQRLRRAQEMIRVDQMRVVEAFDPKTGKRIKEREVSEYDEGPKVRGLELGIGNAIHLVDAITLMLKSFIQRAKSGQFQLEDFEAVLQSAETMYKERLEGEVEGFLDSIRQTVARPSIGRYRAISEIPEAKLGAIPEIAQYRIAPLRLEAASLEKRLNASMSMLSSIPREEGYTYDVVSRYKKKPISEQPLPAELREAIEERTGQQILFAVREMLKMPAFGPGGRTEAGGLMKLLTDLVPMKGTFAEQVKVGLDVKEVEGIGKMVPFLQTLRPENVKAILDSLVTLGPYLEASLSPKAWKGTEIKIKEAKKQLSLWSRMLEQGGFEIAEKIPVPLKLEHSEAELDRYTQGINEWQASDASFSGSLGRVVSGLHKATQASEKAVGEMHWSNEQLTKESVALMTYCGKSKPSLHEGTPVESFQYYTQPWGPGDTAGARPFRPPLRQAITGALIKDLGLRDFSYVASGKYGLVGLGEGSRIEHYDYYLEDPEKVAKRPGATKEQVEAAKKALDEYRKKVRAGLEGMIQERGGALKQIYMIADEFLKATHYIKIVEDEATKLGIGFTKVPTGEAPILRAFLQHKFAQAPTFVPTTGTVITGGASSLMGSMLIDPKVAPDRQSQILHNLPGDELARNIMQVRGTALHEVVLKKFVKPIFENALKGGEDAVQKLHSLLTGQYRMGDFEFIDLIDELKTQSEVAVKARSKALGALGIEKPSLDVVLSKAGVDKAEFMQNMGRVASGFFKNFFPALSKLMPQEWLESPETLKAQLEAGQLGAQVETFIPSLGMGALKERWPQMHHIITSLKKQYPEMAKFIKTISGVVDVMLHVGDALIPLDFKVSAGEGTELEGYTLQQAFYGKAEELKTGKKVQEVGTILGAATTPESYIKTFKPEQLAGSANVHAALAAIVLDSFTKGDLKSKLESDPKFAKAFQDVLPTIAGHLKEHLKTAPTGVAAEFQQFFQTVMQGGYEKIKDAKVPEIQPPEILQAMSEPELQKHKRVIRRYYKEVNAELNAAAGTIGKEGFVDPGLLKEKEKWEEYIRSIEGEINQARSKPREGVGQEKMDQIHEGLVRSTKKGEEKVRDSLGGFTAVKQQMLEDQAAMIRQKGGKVVDEAQKVETKVGDKLTQAQKELKRQHTEKTTEGTPGTTREFEGLADDDDYYEALQHGTKSSVDKYGNVRQMFIDPAESAALIKNEFAAVSNAVSTFGYALTRSGKPASSAVEAYNAVGTSLNKLINAVSKAGSVVDKFDAQIVKHNLATGENLPTFSELEASYDKIREQTSQLLKDHIAKAKGGSSAEGITEAYLQGKTRDVLEAIEKTKDIGRRMVKATMSEPFLSEELAHRERDKIDELTFAYKRLHVEAELGMGGIAKPGAQLAPLEELETMLRQSLIASAWRATGSKPEGMFRHIGSPAGTSADILLKLFERGSAIPGAADEARVADQLARHIAAVRAKGDVVGLEQFQTSIGPELPKILEKFKQVNADLGYGFTVPKFDFAMVYEQIDRLRQHIQQFGPAATLTEEQQKHLAKLRETQAALVNSVKGQMRDAQIFIGNVYEEVTTKSKRLRAEKFKFEFQEELQKAAKNADEMMYKLEQLKHATENLQYGSGQPIQTRIAGFEYAHKMIVDARQQLFQMQRDWHIDPETVRVFAESIGQAEKSSKGMLSLWERFTNTVKTTRNSIYDLFLYQTRWYMSMMVFWAIMNRVQEAFSGLVTTQKEIERAVINLREYSGQVVLNYAKLEAIASTAILNIMVKYGASSKDAAEALYQLGSAGLNTREALAALAPTMALVVGTQAEMRETVKTVAGLYNVMGDTLGVTGNQAAKFRIITDTLAMAFRDHQVEMNEMNSGYQFAISTADSAGISFHQLTAMISVLNDNMIKGSKAGRGLNDVLADIAKDPYKVVSTFRQMIKESESMSSANKEIAGGILDRLTFFSVRNMNMIELLGVLSEVAKASGHDVDVLGRSLQAFGVIGGRALAPLLLQWQKVQSENERFLTQAAGTSEEMGERIAQTMERNFAKIGASFQRFLYPVFAGFATIFKGGLEVAGSASEKVSGFAESQKDAALAAGRGQHWAGLVDIFLQMAPAILTVTGLMSLLGLRFSTFGGIANKIATGGGLFSGFINAMRDTGVSTTQVELNSLRASYGLSALGTSATTASFGMRVLGFALKGLGVLGTIAIIAELINIISQLGQSTETYAVEAEQAWAKVEQANGKFAQSIEQTINRGKLVSDNFKKFQESAAIVSKPNIAEPAPDQVVQSYARLAEALGLIGEGAKTVVEENGKLKTLSTEELTKKYEEVIKPLDVFNGKTLDAQKAQIDLAFAIRSDLASAIRTYQGDTDSVNAASTSLASKLLQLKESLGQTSQGFDIHAMTIGKVKGELESVIDPMLSAMGTLNKERESLHMTTEAWDAYHAARTKSAILQEKRRQDVEVLQQQLEQGGKWEFEPTSGTSYFQKIPRGETMSKLIAAGATGARESKTEQKNINDIIFTNLLASVSSQTWNQISNTAKINVEEARSLLKNEIYRVGLLKVEGAEESYLDVVLRQADKKLFERSKKFGGKSVLDELFKVSPEFWQQIENISKKTGQSITLGEGAEAKVQERIDKLREQAAQLDIQAAKAREVGDLERLQSEYQLRGLEFSKASSQAYEAMARGANDVLTAELRKAQVQIEQGNRAGVPGSPEWLEHLNKASAEMQRVMDDYYKAVMGIENRALKFREELYRNGEKKMRDAQASLMRSIAETAKMSADLLQSTLERALKGNVPVAPEQAEKISEQRRKGYRDEYEATQMSLKIQAKELEILRNFFNEAGTRGDTWSMIRDKFAIEGPKMLASLQEEMNKGKKNLEEMEARKGLTLTKAYKDKAYADLDLMAQRYRDNVAMHEIITQDLARKAATTPEGKVSTFQLSELASKEAELLQKSNQARIRLEKEQLDEGTQHGQTVFKIREHGMKAHLDRINQISSQMPGLSSLAPPAVGGVPGQGIPKAAEQYASIVAKYATGELTQKLVFAIMERESGFDPLAKSPKGARGLMQLMPGTAAQLGLTDITNVDQNIRGGIQYLYYLAQKIMGLDKTQLEQALQSAEKRNQIIAILAAAYNAGETVVKKLQQGYGVPPAKGPITSVPGDDRSYRGPGAKHEGLDYGGQLYEPVSVTSRQEFLGASRSKYGGIIAKFKDTERPVIHLYMHLAEEPKPTKAIFEAGEAFGKMGNTGTSKQGTAEGVHVHYETRTLAGGYLDPRQFVRGGLVAPYPETRKFQEDVAKTFTRITGQPVAGSVLPEMPRGFDNMVDKVEVYRQAMRYAIESAQQLESMGLPKEALAIIIELLDKFKQYPEDSSKAIASSRDLYQSVIDLGLRLGATQKQLTEAPREFIKAQLEAGKELTEGELNYLAASMLAINKTEKDLRAQGITGIKALFELDDSFTAGRVDSTLRRADEIQSAFRISNTRMYKELVKDVIQPNVFRQIMEGNLELSMEVFDKITAYATSKSKGVPVEYYKTMQKMLGDLFGMGVELKPQQFATYVEILKSLKNVDLKESATMIQKYFTTLSSQQSITREQLNLLAGAMTMFGASSGEIWKAWGEVAENQVRRVRSEWSNVQGDMSSELKNLKLLGEGLWQSMQKGLADFASKLKDPFEQLSETVTGIMDSVKGTLEEAFYDAIIPPKEPKSRQDYINKFAESLAKIASKNLAEGFMREFSNLIGGMSGAQKPAKPEDYLKKSTEQLDEINKSAKAEADHAAGQREKQIEYQRTTAENTGKLVDYAQRGQGPQAPQTPQAPQAPEGGTPSGPSSSGAPSITEIPAPPEASVPAEKSSKQPHAEKLELSATSQAEQAEAEKSSISVPTGEASTPPPISFSYGKYKLPEQPVVDETPVEPGYKLPEQPVVDETPKPPITFLFQKGGVVPGSGMGDKVRALLEPGEIVIPNPLARKMQEGGEVLNNIGSMMTGLSEHMQEQFSDMMEPFQKAMNPRRQYYERIGEGYYGEEFGEQLRVEQTFDYMRQQHDMMNQFKDMQLFQQSVQEMQTKWQLFKNIPMTIFKGLGGLGKQQGGLITSASSSPSWQMGGTMTIDETPHDKWGWLRSVLSITSLVSPLLGNLFGKKNQEGKPSSSPSDTSTDTASGKGILGNLWDKVKNLFGGSGEGGGGLLSNLWGGIKNLFGFQEGGMVPGFSFFDFLSPIPILGDVGKLFSRTVGGIGSKLSGSRLGGQQGDFESWEAAHGFLPQESATNILSPIPILGDIGKLFTKVTGGVGNLFDRLGGKMPSGVDKMGQWEAAHGFLPESSITSDIFGPIPIIGDIAKLFSKITGGIGNWFNKLGTRGFATGGLVYATPGMYPKEKPPAPGFPWMELIGTMLPLFSGISNIFTKRGSTKPTSFEAPSSWSDQMVPWGRMSDIKTGSLTSTTVTPSLWDRVKDGFGGVGDFFGNIWSGVKGIFGFQGGGAVSSLGVGPSGTPPYTMPSIPVKDTHSNKTSMMLWMLSLMLPSLLQRLLGKDKQQVPSNTATPKIPPNILNMPVFNDQGIQQFFPDGSPVEIWERMPTSGITPSTGGESPGILSRLWGGVKNLFGFQEGGMVPGKLFEGTGVGPLLNIHDPYIWQEREKNPWMDVLAGMSPFTKPGSAEILSGMARPEALAAGITLPKLRDQLYAGLEGKIGSGRAGKFSKYLTKFLGESSKAPGYHLYEDVEDIRFKGLNPTEPKVRGTAHWDDTITFYKDYPGFSLKDFQNTFFHEGIHIAARRRFNVLEQALNDPITKEYQDTIIRKVIMQKLHAGEFGKYDPAAYQGALSMAGLKKSPMGIALDRLEYKSSPWEKLAFGTADPMRVKFTEYLSQKLGSASALKLLGRGDWTETATAMGLPSPDWGSPPLFKTIFGGMSDILLGKTGLSRIPRKQFDTAFIGKGFMQNKQRADLFQKVTGRSIEGFLKQSASSSPDEAEYWTHYIQKLGLNPNDYVGHRGFQAGGPVDVIGESVGMFSPAGVDKLREDVIEWISAKIPKTEFFNPFHVQGTEQENLRSLGKGVLDFTVPDSASALLGKLGPFGAAGITIRQLRTGLARGMEGALGGETSRQLAKHVAGFVEKSSEKEGYHLFSTVGDLIFRDIDFTNPYFGGRYFLPGERMKTLFEGRAGKGFGRAQAMGLNIESKVPIESSGIALYPKHFGVEERSIRDWANMIFHEGTHSVQDMPNVIKTFGKMKDPLFSRFQEGVTAQHLSKLYGLPTTKSFSDFELETAFRLMEASPFNTNAQDAINIFKYLSGTREQHAFFSAEALTRKFENYLGGVLGPERAQQFLGPNRMGIWQSHPLFDEFFGTEAKKMLGGFGEAGIIGDLKKNKTELGQLVFRQPKEFQRATGMYPWEHLNELLTEERWFYSGKTPTEKYIDELGRNIKDVIPFRKFGFGGPTLVPGSGKGDTVPALLEPGEYVLPNWFVKDIGLGTLESLRLMNKSRASAVPEIVLAAAGGAIPTFAAGGYVPHISYAPQAQTPVENKVTMVTVVDDSSLEQYLSTRKYGDVFVNNIGSRITRRMSTGSARGK